MKAPKLKTILRIVITITFGIFSLGPVFWMIATSLKHSKDIIAYPPVLFSNPPTIIHYHQLFDPAAYARAGEQMSYRWGTENLFTLVFPNTFIIAGGTTIITLACATLAAYSLSRYIFKWRKFLGFFIIAMRMLPPIAMVMPLIIFFKNLGLSDTLLSLILAYTTISLPFTIWMLKACIDEIPRDLEEAAMIDGCSRIKAFFLVTLPLVAPGIGVSSIFTFLLTWNDFQISFFLTGIHARTVPTIAPLFVTEMGTRYGEMSSYGIICIIPAIIIGIFAQKALIRGLTLGAVKG